MAKQSTAKKSAKKAAKKSASSKTATKKAAAKKTAAKKSSKKAAKKTATKSASKKAATKKAAAKKAAVKKPRTAGSRKKADATEEVLQPSEVFTGSVDWKGETYRSPFGQAELTKYYRMLVQRRAEVSGDIAHLVRDAMEHEEGHSTPNHIAERGTDADFQQMSLTMIGDEETLLWQIDRAIRKITLGRPIPYGLCEHSLQPIPKVRLQLLPWTPLSIDGANHMEENNLMLQDMLLED